MKVLHVCTGWLSHQHWISDNEKADAACAVIQAAMNSYDRYGNDKDKTVTIDTGDGSATFRVESLVSVSLNDVEAGGNTLIERAVWEANINSKVAARLAPAAS